MDSPNSNTQNVSVLQEPKDAPRLLIINSKRLLRKRPFSAIKICPKEEMIFTHYLYNAYLSTSLISSRPSKPVQESRSFCLTPWATALLGKHKLANQKCYSTGLKCQKPGIRENNSQLCGADKRPLSHDPL